MENGSAHRLAAARQLKLEPGPHVSHSGRARTCIPTAGNPLLPHHIAGGDRSEPRNCFHATSALHRI
jgi:hypothetical protein